MSETELGDRLASVMDRVADGVTVIDRAGRIRFANDAAARLLGRQSVKEVIGAAAAELMAEYDLLDADGNPMDPAQMPTRRALAGEQDPEAVVRFRRRGSYADRWSTVRARLLRGDEPEGDLVVSAFQDITSLKESEARLRLLAEASAILAETVDYQVALRQIAQIVVPHLADWCVVDVLEWTRGVSRVAVAHADPGNAQLAEEVWRRWPSDPEHSGAVHEMLRRRSPLLIHHVDEGLLAAAAQTEEHLAVLRQLGMRSALIVPLEARGEVLGAMTLVQTVSDRTMDAEDVGLVAELGRRAGAAVDVARLAWETLENARLRDEFIAVASHDMRTPLAAVRGYAQLARRHLERDGEPDVASLQRWLADIDTSVERLSQLVTELLDATLVRAEGAVPLQLTQTTLGAVLAEVVERHRPLSDQHRISVELPEQDPKGTWDAGRLARVLDNLVSNAVKFSPDGGEVRLSAGENDGWAFVSVSDRGIGIAASEREAIFNPLVRGGNAGQVAGTGLGLAGSRRLVELMGGTIQVESELGRGSTFTVRLPRTPAGAAEAAAG